MKLIEKNEVFYAAGLIFVLPNPPYPLVRRNDEILKMKSLVYVEMSDLVLSLLLLTSHIMSRLVAGNDG